MHQSRIDPKIAVCVVFVAALFMSIMDGTIVNVALPSLGRQLGASATSVDAVVVSYLVSLAVIIPASGWLGDRFGTKRIFISALALFSIASALCGLASNLPMLIIFRVLQGLAGGAMTPVGTTMLYRVYPPAQRVQVSRILMIPTVIAPAAGPVLGGFLVDQLSWRWVFYVNVPVGILTCIFGLLCLPEQRESATRRFDLAGFLSAGIGLALLMYALSEGSSYGWTSPAILGGIVGGLLTLTAFVFIELRTTEPMIELRLLRERLFSTTNLISLFASAGFLGLLYAAPLFLQEARGVSALTSGLTTFPEAIGVVLSTQLVARLYPRVGPRRLLVGGLLGVTITMSLLCLIGLETNLWFMRLLIFLSGFSMAYVFLPVQAAAFANISSASTGQASALYNAQRQLGASLGVALLSAVISAVGPIYLNHSGASVPNINAYHAAFLAAASLTLIGAIIALTVRDRDAASTMKIQSKQAQTETLPKQPVDAEIIS